MDMTTEYLGLKLKNPLVASASPMSRDVSTARRLEDAGVSAMVVYSLFQEQIEHESDWHDHFQSFGTESYAEATSYFPRVPQFPRGPEEYCAHIQAIKQAVGIPVIASLNGSSLGGWTAYARKLEQAGADALELNIYHVATDPNESAADVEQRYVDVLTAVRHTVQLPVALKIGPYFTSLAHFAKRLDDHGVNGLVLFNRFYQPDIDLESLEIVPDLVLSSPHEMRLPLRWIAVLDAVVDANLAATTGVYTSTDALKLLMAGADVTMLCAALLRQGPKVVGDMLRGMESWMEEHEYLGVKQLQGSMNQRACSDPAAFERANYMHALQSYA